MDERRLANWSSKGTKWQEMPTSANVTTASLPERVCIDDIGNRPGASLTPSSSLRTVGMTLACANPPELEAPKVNFHTTAPDASPLGQHGGARGR